MLELGEMPKQRGKTRTGAGKWIVARLAGNSWHNMVVWMSSHSLPSWSADVEGKPWLTIDDI